MRRNESVLGIDRLPSLVILVDSHDAGCSKQAALQGSGLLASGSESTEEQMLQQAIQ